MVKYSQSLLSHWLSAPALNVAICEQEHILLIAQHMWCVLGNHGLGWKSKLFSRAKKVKKLIFWNFKFDKRFLRLFMSRGFRVWFIRPVIISTWWFYTTHGSRWKVNFSVDRKMWKSKKAHFLELQVHLAIS